MILLCHHSYMFRKLMIMKAQGQLQAILLHSRRYENARCFAKWWIHTMSSGTATVQSLRKKPRSGRFRLINLGNLHNLLHTKLQAFTLLPLSKDFDVSTSPTSVTTTSLHDNLNVVLLQLLATNVLLDRCHQRT